MAHGDAQEGKWRGNWRMECVASTLTLLLNVVYPALLPLMRTPRLPAVDWRPRRFKWTRPFRRKMKSGFCACAITFHTSSTITHVDTTWKRKLRPMTPQFDHFQTNTSNPNLNDSDDGLCSQTWLKFWALFTVRLYKESLGGRRCCHLHVERGKVKCLYAPDKMLV